MQNNPIISFPNLKRNKLNDKCPLILGVCPGLELSEQGYHELDFPLSKVQAKAYLQEVNAISEEKLSREELNIRANYLKSFTPQAFNEKIDLNNQPKQEKVNDALRYKAQHFLLMAWKQQEQIEEIREIAAKYKLQSEKLNESLVDNDDEKNRIQMLDELLIQTGEMLPTWEKILENLAVFLPEDAILCTDDIEFIDYLIENKLINTFDKKVPQELLNYFEENEILISNINLSQVIANSKGKNWLDRSIEVIIIK